MSATLVNEVSDQAQKFWAPIFKDELLESSLLPSLVNKDYQGEIKQGGDTAYVSMISRPTAERKTIGAGSDTFSSQKLTTTRVGIVADQRITASFELEDLIDLQTQIGNPDGKSKIKQVLVEAAQIELNNYLYSLVAPSASAPDHILSGVATFDATQLLSVRQLAAQAKWMKDGGWWTLLDPSYMNDILAAQTLTSTDYTGSDTPVIGGQVSNTRFGFNILEDNSAGILQLSPASAGMEVGLAFHPDFLYLVMGDVQMKVSDLHSNHQHGYLVSVDMWVGAKLGIQGNVKHIQIYNT